jgi:FixJ family two-component response regulator
MAFASGDEFLRSNRLRITSCLIADVQMPDMSGLELYGRSAALGNRIPTILITAYPDKSLRTRALNAGVIAYLTKPFSEGELVEAINAAGKQGAVFLPVKGALRSQRLGTDLQELRELQRCVGAALIVGVSGPTGFGCRR